MSTASSNWSSEKVVARLEKKSTRLERSMRQIYINESYVLAMNSRNRLESEGIDVELRNEFAAGAPVGGHSIWPELWVHDSDYEKAMKILQTSAVDVEPDDWLSEECNERIRAISALAGSAKRTYNKFEQATGGAFLVQWIS